MSICTAVIEPTIIGNENIPSQVNTGRHRTHASLASAPTALPLRTRRSNSLDGGPGMCETLSAPIRSMSNRL